jgi:hypothetical protein
MAALRYVAAKGPRQTLGSLHIACCVKPGASHKREGILDVTENVVDLAVSAQAKEGEANKAVRELIARVSLIEVDDWSLKSTSFFVLSSSCKVGFSHISLTDIAVGAMRTKVGRPDIQRNEE